MVKSLEKGSGNRTYSVLTARHNGLCFPRPSESGRGRVHCIYAERLPGTGDLDGKNKQLKARQE